jgi:hypothetical protein
MKAVKLYCPERYRHTLPHTLIMAPFWGSPGKETMPYMYAAMRSQHYSANDFVLVEHIADADYVHIPHHYPTLKLEPGGQAVIDMIESEARKARKLLLIDNASDIERSLEAPDVVELRLSQYRYRMRPNEITVPFAADDLLETFCGGKEVIRKKSAVPSVGFAGWAHLSLKTRLKTDLKEFPITVKALFDRRRAAEHKGVIFRERVLRALKKTSNIKAHFLERPNYSGHIKTIAGAVEQNRKEFVDNLLDSDYALCVRGDANSSIRFYEALSLGRIPLFVDTQCVLPLEDRLNYKDFCLFVDFRDISGIGDILSTFHAGLSPEQFEEMQHKAREVFTNYLSLKAFSPYLADQLYTYAQKYYAQHS